MEPRPIPQRLAEQIEAEEALDRIIEPLHIDPGADGDDPVRAVLSGSWLGHSLHPLLVSLPLGFWTSATVLDLVGGRQTRRARQRLVALGLLSALPTAATGVSDWRRLDRRDARVGVVHAAANGVALVCYAWSYRQRRRGRRGILAGMAGSAAASAGGYLGGHLTLTRGVTAGNRLLPGYQPVVDLTTPTPFGDGEPIDRVVAGI